jgi:hypothetical protein
LISTAGGLQMEQLDYDEHYKHGNIHGIHSDNNELVVLKKYPLGHESTQID